MTIWTIYERPEDAPDHFVVRRWEVSNVGVIADPSCQEAETLEGARLLIPAGNIRCTRMPEDDPSIVETWM